MRRLSVRFGVPLGIVLAVILGAPQVQASARSDTKGPKVSVSASPNFLIGQNFADPIDDDGDLVFFWNGVGKFEYRWSAVDPSGICRYTVDIEMGVDGWQIGVVDYETNATSGQYGFLGDGYFNSDDLSQVRINAYDCLGNMTSVERRATWPSIPVDYGGEPRKGWRQVQCECAMGDSTLRTAKKGRSLTTVVNANGYTKRFALVMAKGPARGRANIFYDGKLVKKVDSYSPVKSDRVIVWEVEIAGTADHKIKIVNAATPGRAKIEIDALIQG